MKFISLFNKLYIQEALLTLLDKFVILLGSFVILQILAERLSKSEFGVFSLGISIFVFISMFPFTAIDHAVNRYYSIYQKRGMWLRALNTITFLLFILAIIYCLTALIVNDYVTPLISGLDNIYPILFFSLIEIYRVALLNIENVKRNRAINLNSNIFVYVLRILIIIYLFKEHMLEIAFIFWGFCLISLANIGFILLINYKDYVGLLKNTIKENINIGKELLVFSLPIIIWGPFIWAQNMINRWLIDIYYEESIVAEFVAVNAVATLLPTALFGVVWALMTPILYKKEDDRSGAILRLNRWVNSGFAFILTIGFAACWMLSEFVFSYVFTKYSDSAWLLPYLYLSAAFIQWAAYSSSELYARLNISSLLMPNIIPGLLAILIGIPLVYFLDPLIGATVNAMSTGVIYFLLMTYIIRRNRDNTIC